MAWGDKNVLDLFLQDFLHNRGNYLSPKVSDKCKIKVNLLQYCSITSAIAAYLKSYASVNGDLEDPNSIRFQLSKGITLNLKLTFCKQFYKIFVAEINTEPKYCD